MEQIAGSVPQHDNSATVGYIVRSTVEHVSTSNFMHTVLVPPTWNFSAIQNEKIKVDLYSE